MRSLLSMLFLAATTAAVAADITPSGDLARLQGRWMTQAGPRRDIPVVLEVEGNQIRVVITLPHGLPLRVRGELVLDETAAPRALTWTKFAGLDGQDLPDIPAIYELQDETFRLCNGGPNGARPTAFQPGDGVLADLLVFTRPAPDDRPAIRTADRPPPGSTPNSPRPAN